MKYELMLRMRVKSRHPIERVEEQLQNLFAIGTVRDAIGDGLGLDEDLHLLELAVRKSQHREAPCRAKSGLPRRVSRTSRRN